MMKLGHNGHLNAAEADTLKFEAATKEYDISRSVYSLP